MNRIRPLVKVVGIFAAGRIRRTLFSPDTIPYSKAIRNDLCAYCGGRGGTFDHIHPRAQGGKDGWENIIGACCDCNRKKGGTTMLWFLIKQGGLK